MDKITRISEDKAEITKEVVEVVDLVELRDQLNRYQTGVFNLQNQLGKLNNDIVDIEAKINSIEALPVNKSAND